MTKLIEQQGQRYGWRGALVLPEEYFDTVSGATYTVAVDSASYALTLQPVGFIYNRVLPVTSANYTLSLQSIGLARGYALPVDSSGYTLTGRNVTVTRNLTLSVDSVSYALSLQDVTLSYTAALSRTLAVDSTSYTLTGRDLTVTDGGPYVPPADNTAVPGEDRWSSWGIPLTYEKWERLAKKYEKESEVFEPNVKIESEELDLTELLPRLETRASSLKELLRDAELLRLEEAQALANAMMVRDAIAMATIAYNLELAVQLEKDAIAGFLMFMD